MRAQEFIQEVKARYEMTDLDPWTFDQTPAGWRGLPSSARQADALNQYIDRYVKDGQFVGAPQGQKTVKPYILYWHLGQVLTQMGRNAMASRVMRQALDDSDPNWNAYVMATISFLRKDRKDFDHWAPLARGNEETIQRLTAGWGRPYKQAYAGQQGVAEGDKMSLINLDQSLANTPPVWKKFIGSLPPQLAREFVDERPRPDQDDIDFLTPLRLVSSQPVSVRVADLLRHPENQGTIGRSPDDVVAAVNQRWGLKIPSGKKYDPNPARYRAYAQMASGTASPSVMADGVILFGAGRFVAAALRGDETMRVWSMTRKQGVTEGPQR